MPDQYIAFVKRDCPTCELVAPALAQLAGSVELTVYTQDDPGFPAGVSNVIDDTRLDESHRRDIEIVPTLLQVEGGNETSRVIGWDKGEWQRFTGIADLGAELIDWKAGCGAINVEPAVLEQLKIRFDETGIQSRRVQLGSAEDEIEAMYERDWSDGLPLVPPTEVRVLRMLQGTLRDPQESLGKCPPNMGELTVEKAAVNAVMAGCKPEYLPVVLAAAEAILDDAFGMHGVLATTMYVSPVLVVNGPVRNRIGMNSGVNVLGQGNRANATIGRSLQLIIRNVGGGKPGEVDRANLGNPGKYTYCFAEDEEGSCWSPLSTDFGFQAGESTVTAFAGYGLQGIVDQKARDPESLCQSFAAALRSMANPKIAPAGDAILVVCPEHERVFREAGWSKRQLSDSLYELTQIPGAELVQGVGGIAEGIPQSMASETFSKIRPGGLLIVRAGGGAGMFSAIIGGWLASGPVGSVPVARPIN
ncbi:thiol reductase thioredoxin [Chromatiales bacterium (ex Bugula neritina AB1)]|nr:thiol reductase thioredoxin [Chromatiales bacterium (ex Bugula neritina AB1)]